MVTGDGNVPATLKGGMMIIPEREEGTDVEEEIDNDGIVNVVLLGTRHKQPFNRETRY